MSSRNVTVRGRLRVPWRRRITRLVIVSTVCVRSASPIPAGIPVATRRLDLAGVFSCALLGGAVARTVGLDPVGFLVVGIISGLGGGVIRRHRGRRSHGDLRVPPRAGDRRRPGHHPGSGLPAHCRAVRLEPAQQPGRAARSRTAATLRHGTGTAARNGEEEQSHPRKETP
ncbi:TRIC cation channel family protein [Streptomyces sp. NPDC001292]|uniref:TRIC cation channel family protein n=1 Tax=Streptomyces sp. NPDC001292 TaxID=3364558 RepID=UPI0036C250FB